MNITKDSAVTINYKITDTQGKLLDQGDVAYLHGGYDNIFAKVEEAMDGKAAGDSVSVELAKADAFGDIDESLKRTIPKGEFPPGVKVGGQLRGVNDKGEPQIYHVIKIKGPVVQLDGNHPLAGQDLRFTAKITEVRPATAVEIEHRHVHGGHGHHH